MVKICISLTDCVKNERSAIAMMMYYLSELGRQRRNHPVTFDPCLNLNLDLNLNLNLIALILGGRIGFRAVARKPPCPLNSSGDRCLKVKRVIARYLSICFCQLSISSAVAG